MLPNRIFFTGVPGSRWSGIAQIIETIPGFNTSDRTYERSYSHSQFSGHKGAYFGRLMEFDARLDAAYLDQAWIKNQGCKLTKSHDWAYCLHRVRQAFPDDWIMLVHRPDENSFNWWKEAGGFDINYPSYKAYINDDIMRREISWQNQAILEFAKEYELEWRNFNSEWVLDVLGHKVDEFSMSNDIKVAILK